MKILNLYAGIGGNRKLWGNDHEITAIELNPEIAAIYQDFFPKDKVIVTDAHQYLLDHFKKFDFIWSSPPCPTHSRWKLLTSKMKQKGQKRSIEYPNMELYQEIILLKFYHKGKWIVENVISYYDPLIQPQKSGRHYFWANFLIKNVDKGKAIIKQRVKELQKTHGFDISEYKLSSKLQKRKDQILRNCVDPELGLYILDRAMNIIRKNKTAQFEFKY